MSRPDLKIAESFLTWNRWPILGGLLGTLTTLWILFGLVPRLLYGQTALDQSGFGNTYEMMNSLFAALAFAGVVFTVLLQSEELRLQRQELEETQAELRRTASAQERSEQMLFLAAYLNACNSAIDGLKMAGAPKTPWDAASANLVAHIDAVRKRLSSKKGFAELIAVSTAEMFCQRALRINSYLKGRIANCPRTPQEDRLDYIRQCTQAAKLAMEDTIALVCAAEIPDNNCAALFRGVLGTLTSPLDGSKTSEDSNFQQHYERVLSAQSQLESVCRQLEALGAR